MHYEGETNRVGHPTTPDGKIIWLDNADRLKLKGLGVPVNKVQERINNGWKPYDAINFSDKYEMHDGQIYYTHTTNEHKFYISADDMEKAEIEVGLNPRTIAKRLNRGFSVQEALTREPATSDVYEVKQDIEAQIAKQRRKEERRRMKKAERAKQRDMERRPHMYDGTPQHHSFGEYAQYLADSYTFKCKEVTK